MIFKRKIYKELLEWKNSKIQNSAILIEGARRIGKSTIVQELAKNEFDDYLIVDFRRESNLVKDLFENTKDLDSFYRNFFMSQGKSLKEGSLIVFDEVQFCPKAREAIKDFVSDGRYKFIETGSLISIKENTKNIMIPSEERRIDMYPMDFEEYLWAVGEEQLYGLVESAAKDRIQIMDEVHQKMMEKFRTYMLIGGMPKVISIFLETNSIKLARDEQNDILKLYRDDLRKHDLKYKTICHTIFNAIPSQLAKDSKRFLLSSTNRKRFLSIEKSLNDLEEFHIINKVCCLDSLETPLSLHEMRDKFKLYFCDVGLMSSFYFPLSNDSEGRECLKFIKGQDSMNLGALYESVVGQELISKGKNLFYHKFNLATEEKKKTYEIDFVFEQGLKATAIEVKSTKRYKTSSLDNLKNKYPQFKLSKYVLGLKNVSFDSDKTTLPVYITSLVNAC